MREKSDEQVEAMAQSLLDEDPEAIATLIEWSNEDMEAVEERLDDHIAEAERGLKKVLGEGDPPRT